MAWHRQLCHLPTNLSGRFVRPAKLFRSLSTGIGAVGEGVPQVFDRNVKTIQRDCLALRQDRVEYRRLRLEIAERLTDKLLDTHKKFPHAADVGCADGAVLETLGGRGGVERLIQIDSSRNMLAHCRSGTVGDIEVTCVQADEETLPFPEQSLDLILSNLSLHWINDVPGTLIQMRRALRPDGLLLASMLGGDTLFELRQSLLMAELEREGGVSPRVSPMAGVSDAGSLLGRAGFNLTGIDMDTVTIHFSSALECMHAMQGMGEANALSQRRVLPRETLLAAAAIYEAMHRDEQGIPATFQIIYLSGWAPHESQQKPKKRGSATVSLEDLGKKVEELEDADGSAPSEGETK